MLIPSGLEGGSKNQALGDCGARLALGAPPTAFVRWVYHPTKSAQLLIGDHVPYKGGLLVACPGSGTAGSLCAKKKKKKKKAIFVHYTSLGQIGASLFFSSPSAALQSTAHLCSRGVRAQDSPDKSLVSVMHRRRAQSGHRFCQFLRHVSRTGAGSPLVTF